MRRATTPTHVFKISKDDFLITDVVEAKLTYAQDSEVLVEKSLSQLSSNLDANLFFYQLTQEETKKFTPGKALVQMRLKTSDDIVWASQMLYVNVEPVLESEVL